MSYIYLLSAIVCEVFATTFLKAANGFTVLLPSLAVALGYGGAFYFLSLSLSGIQLGTAYAIWSGLGIVLGFGCGIFCLSSKTRCACNCRYGFDYLRCFGYPAVFENSVSKKNCKNLKLGLAFFSDMVINISFYRMRV